MHAIAWADKRDGQAHERHVKIGRFGWWFWTAKGLSLCIRSLSVLVQVAFLPQRAIAAPGRSLRDQLTYPCPQPCPAEHLLALLKAVKLEHLLLRVHSRLERDGDWQGTPRDCIFLQCTLCRSTEYVNIYIS